MFTVKHTTADETSKAVVKRMNSRSFYARWNKILSLQQNFISYIYIYIYFIRFKESTHQFSKRAPFHKRFSLISNSARYTHARTHKRMHTQHTHPFTGPLSGTTWVSRYQKGKTNLDFTEATDSEWQRHQLGHMQICTSLQTNNHASTPPLSFLQAGCPYCRPTVSKHWRHIHIYTLYTVA